MSPRTTPPSEAASSDSLTNLTGDERLHHLMEWLRSGRKLTTALAADAFGVSRRTIARDLSHLRDAFSLDISFDQAQGTYVLAEAHTALPFLPFPSLAPVLLDAQPESASGTDGARANTVSVRFSARAIQAYVARGGRVPDGASNEDGSLDVRFAPQNLDEFLCYVLSRGHHIEVLRPRDLRQRVHMEIRRMLTLYEEVAPFDA